MPLSPSPVRERTLLIAAAVATAGIFAVDLALPLGAAVATLYVFVILLGLWIRTRYFPAAAAAAATVLLMADTAANWTTDAPTVIYLNRPLLTLVFWMTAVLVRRFTHIERESVEQIRQLADLKYALDRSAIVATTDVSGRITYVNDKFCEISKYSRDELIGQDHRIINSGTHPKEFIRGLWTTIARGQVWQGEFLNRAKDGTPYWVDTTIVPFVDHRNHPYQYIAIRQDITERKQMEVRLRDQAALARVGQMAAMVAHEVRNPLAGIKGAMQVMASRRPEGDSEIPVVADMVSRIDSLNVLIGDLLHFARPQPPRLSSVRLASLFEQASLAVRLDPIGEHIDIRVTSPDVEIEVDADLVKALLINLLMNAAQAMQGWGVIQVTGSVDASHVRISIRDYGPGIPADLATLIFEPFFTTKSRGGGLGLAIARRTAELHGGSLVHVAPRDGGAEMVVTLAEHPARSEGGPQPA